MDRRTALGALGLILGHVYGKPVVEAQGTAMQLVLDPVDVIVVQYRGQRVMVSPAEVVAALQSAPTYFPMQQQMAPSPSKR